MPYTIVKRHFSHSSKGKRFVVSRHKRKVVGSKVRGRSGKAFKSLARRVEREYLKKGYSKKRAERIGRATAGKVYWEKFGKRKGSRILRRER